MVEHVIDRESMDIVKDNVERMKQLFPEVFCEDAIDFEKLQHVLGNYVDTDPERYNFNWWGKAAANRLAQTPSAGTLLPCVTQSKDWDTTENLYIEGDNLEVLKLLQKSYYGQVKMIYIDPPYNTGKDWVYPDDYHDSLNNYLHITGQLDDDGYKFTTNSETDGRFHTKWLNMMYPRLKLARNLLAEDGVIFISIDYNEVDNLKKVCNEVFGDNNFIADVTWKRKRGRDNSAKWFSKSHEYLFVVAKNRSNFKTNYLELDEETKLAYKNPDNDPRGNYRTLACWARGTQSGVKYDFTTQDGQYFQDRLWLFSKENLEKMDRDNRLIIRGDNIYRKLFLTENKGKIPETLWDNVSNAANASDEIKSMFNKIVFDTPKPLPYIMEMLKIATSSDDIIMDFFAGSSTTAHAVMQLNAQDGGNRKFIMVQIQEPTGEESEAHKAGYKNICEIGQERIRLAGEKIKAENPAADLDVGFKVFKLATSNIKPWKAEPDNIEEALRNSINPFVEGRTQLDKVYEIILKYGLELTYKVETHILSGKTVYDVAYGAMLICLENNITPVLAQDLVALKNQLDPLVCRIVVSDGGFKTDSDKFNFKEILKMNDIHELITI
ncbi:MAG: DNA methylase N-4 [Epulopiscium sp. Nele67-Bin001]|nr:MAG: DNA methylase N-4 [Epulopiscium sp. Nele67-Bin001]